MTRAELTEYRIAREAYLRRRELATRGYATEVAEYDEPPMTLGAWMRATAGPAEHVCDPMSESELSALAAMPGW